MEATNHIISAHYWRQKGYIGEAITRTHLALISDPFNHEALMLDRLLEDKYKMIYWAKAAAAYGKKDVDSAVSACVNILKVIPNDQDTLKLLAVLRRNIDAQGGGGPKFMSGP
jgi:hypothetical protein